MLVKKTSEKEGAAFGHASLNAYRSGMNAGR
jgi:hypothetical protein